MENTINPLGEDVPDTEINAAEINALLQARGLGRVGAILARGGTPTKNGAASLFMLRGLAAHGYLIEKVAEDEDNKTIVYFDLAGRADLKFLDQCASAAIVELCTQNEQLSTVIKTVRESSLKLGDELKVLRVDLVKFESEFTMILALAAEIKQIAREYADGEAAGPKACATIESKAKALMMKINGMIED